MRLSGHESHRKPTRKSAPSRAGQNEASENRLRPKRGTSARTGARPKRGTPTRTGDRPKRGTSTRIGARPEDGAFTRNRTRPGQGTPVQTRARRVGESQLPADIYVRRVLSIVLLLVLVAALIGGLIWVGHQIKAGINATAQTQKKAVSSAPPIADCKPQDLSISFLDAPAQTRVGEGWVGRIAMVNRSKEACLTDGGPASVGLIVKSGDQTVVDQPKCAAKDAKKPLLIGPGRKWEADLEWNGLSYSNCEEQSNSGAGTYVVAIQHAGESKPVDQRVVIVR